MAYISHIPGKNNVVADLLSRFKFDTASWHSLHQYVSNFMRIHTHIDLTKLNHDYDCRYAFCSSPRGHGGRVVTLSPPTSEAGVLFLARPQVGKLVVACRWSVVYSTEP